MSNTESGLSVIVTALINGTVYAPDNSTVTGKLGIATRRCNELTIHFDNPAGVTCTYTLQGSNMTDDEAKAGIDKWVDYVEVAPVTLVGAVQDYFEVLDWGWARARVKCVGNASGSATERVCTKTQG